MDGRRFFARVFSDRLDLWMDKNTVLYVIAAVLFGFIGGFLLANSMNRSEIAALRSQSGQALTSANVPAANGNSDAVLSDAEIKAKIAEADKNPANFQFQKDLGTSLYKYAAMKQQVGLLPETIRILARAESLNDKDFEVLAALGNAHFDLGFNNKDADEFQKARDVYARALAVKPSDADVATDAAITYYVQSPPEYAKAVTGLEKVVAANPQHTRSMQFLAQSYVKLGRTADAQKTLDRIRSLDPTNDAIADLTKQIAAAQGGKSQ
jgi:tetratricopeptide (TPR) repeat protein